MASSIVSSPSRYNSYRTPTSLSYPAGAYTSGNYTQMSSSECTVIYDGFVFNGIDLSTNIVGYKVSCEACTYNNSSSLYTSYLDFMLVTDYYNGQSSSTSNTYYTGITPGNIRIFESNVKNETYASKSYTNTDTSSAEVQWMQNNIGLLTGGTKFGIRLAGARCRVRNLKITIYYAVPEIYIGGTRASSVYVGSTKATAVYIGSTRIL